MGRAYQKRPLSLIALTTFLFAAGMAILLLIVWWFVIMDFASVLSALTISVIMPVVAFQIYRNLDRLRVREQEPSLLEQ